MYYQKTRYLINGGIVLLLVSIFAVFANLSATAPKDTSTQTGLEYNMDINNTPDNNYRDEQQVQQKQKRTHRPSQNTTHYDNTERKKQMKQIRKKLEELNKV